MKKWASNEERSERSLGDLVRVVGCDANDNGEANPRTEHGRGGLSPMDLTLGEVCDEKVIREVIV